MLPEDTLLEIFDIYRLDTTVWSRDGYQWDWLRLAQVCRRWRGVISISPHRLDLWILCKSGASPIERILGFWSSIPLIVRFKAASPSLLALPDNIAVALRHGDRICEIDLGVTSSTARSIVEVIQKPLQALKCIRITIKDPTGLPLRIRSSFLGGSAPHVREIKLDGIAFPFLAIRQVLSSTNNLVQLQLSNIPNDVYFSPLDFVDALSTLIHLESLTIGFHSPASRPPQPQPPPSTMTGRPRTTKRTTTLSSLTLLDFHGASEYLEEFVSKIDLPSLHKITIKLFNQILFEIPHFCQFIPHVKALGSPTWVFITHSAESVNVIFVQEGKSSNENCFLGTSCRRLDWQLSFVTQLTTQLSPSILSSVRSLSIKKVLESDMPTGVEDVDSPQWLELFQPFRHVTQVHVWERRLVPGIVQALVSEAGVLPELDSLHLSGYRGSPSVVKDAEQLVSTRRLAGHAVRLIG